MFSIKSRSTINDERPRTPPPSSDNSRNGAWGFLSAVIDSILSGNEELTECGSLKVSVVFMGKDCTAGWVALVVFVYVSGVRCR